MSLRTNPEKTYTPPTHRPPIVNTQRKTEEKTTNVVREAPKKTWGSNSTKTPSSADPNFPPLATTTTSTTKPPETTKVNSVAQRSFQTDTTSQKNPWELRKKQNEIAGIFETLRD